MTRFPAHVLKSVLDKPWQAVELENPIPLDALPTPALVLYRPAFERNLKTMAQHLKKHGKGQRPHAKTHKCPLIAQQQMAAGAVGVCAAKLGEVAALVSAGVQDVLITSPLTSAPKIDVLNTLLEHSQDLKLVVDSSTGMDALEQGIATDRRLGVVLDFDVELGRTGTRDDALAQKLHDRVSSDPRFYFAGIQHYAGHLMHLQTFEERKTRSLESWQAVLERVAKFSPKIITGGGTGTFDIDVLQDQITDLQVGSYIFMDREYLDIDAQNDAQGHPFESSLSVACTFVSAPKQGMATVDGGYKAFASDSVTPMPITLDGCQFYFGGDEHGFVKLPAGYQEPVLGQVHQFMVPHCDPTVNLHDYYWVQEADGLIHNLWPITARGASW